MGFQGIEINAKFYKVPRHQDFSHIINFKFYEYYVEHFQNIDFAFHFSKQQLQCIIKNGELIDEFKFIANPYVSTWDNFNYNFTVDQTELDNFDFFVIYHIQRNLIRLKTLIYVGFLDETDISYYVLNIPRKFNSFLCNKIDYVMEFKIPGQLF